MSWVLECILGQFEIRQIETKSIPIPKYFMKWGPWRSLSLSPLYTHKTNIGMPLHVYSICNTYTFALMYIHTLAYLFCFYIYIYMWMSVCVYGIWFWISVNGNFIFWHHQLHNRSTWDPSNLWSLPILPVWCTSTLATHYLGGKLFQLQVCYHISGDSMIFNPCHTRLKSCASWR